MDKGTDHPQNVLEDEIINSYSHVKLFMDAVQDSNLKGGRKEVGNKLEFQSDCLSKIQLTFKQHPVLLLSPCKPFGLPVCCRGCRTALSQSVSHSLGEKK